jgi:hypothetical protein
MAGRTENNIKNRFNMLLKMMKDETIRKMEHDNIMVDSKGLEKKAESLEEKELIVKLIERKKTELRVKE